MKIITDKKLFVLAAFVAMTAIWPRPVMAATTAIDQIISDFGSANSSSDLNADGMVNVFDYSIFVSQFGGQPAAGGLPAFSGTQGWGAQAWQNCNRSQLKVIEVTNLNDSGTGSLRDAMDATGPRIVVFKVGGILKLQSKIVVRDDKGQSCLYVAGQTAPGGGILITTDPAVTSLTQSSIDLKANNVILRYLKLRGNNNGNIDIDNSNYIILDHLSLSWTTNDSLDIWRGTDTHSGPIHNVTVQRSLSAEIYNVHPTHANIGGEHSLSYERTVGELSLHHNIFAHDGYRFPNMSAQDTKLVDNVMYNWKWKATMTNHGPTVDIIANYYKPGPMTEWEASGYSQGTSIAKKYRALDNESTDELGNPYPYPASIYAVRNVLPPYFTDESADNWVLSWDEYLSQPTDPKYKRNPWAPLSPAPIPVEIESPYLAYTSLVTNQDAGASIRLDCSGNHVVNRDSVDQQVLQDVANGTQWFNL